MAVGGLQHRLIRRPVLVLPLDEAVQRGLLQAEAQVAVVDDGLQQRLEERPHQREEALADELKDLLHGHVSMVMLVISSSGGS